MPTPPKNPLQRTPKPQAIVTDPRQRPVKVKLVMDDEKPKIPPWIEIHVGSLVKRNAWAVAKLTDIDDVIKLRKDVDKATNLCCDYLGRTHGDMLNSPDVVRAALEALDEMIANAAQAKRGRPRPRA